ncbi:MAG TPA: hypothetical protein VNH12_06830, partial [Burkholderiales bacterium]|nr:hypothetical protein [Burkholderiales bacterium]
MRLQIISVAAVLAFAASSAAWADPDCKPRNDSVPTSLGADGWAAVDGPVTGGCGATPSRVFHVYDRRGLVLALNKDLILLIDRLVPGLGIRKQDLLDQRAKIIYVHGTIDLNVDHKNQP